MQTETKTHSMSSVQACQNCKKDFTIEPEDFNFYEKMKVPPPTFCPECREIRRCAFRNERFLYKRNCDLCGLSVVSRVSPNKSYKMYCQKCWWSDKWSGFDYGIDYDFSRPFFEQFKELLFSTPHIAIQNANSVNSEWVNQETDDKNCYLNVGGHYNEDSAYNTYELFGKNCFDNFWILNSENCSNNINCEKSFNIHFSRDTRDSIDSFFLFDCRNCTHCIGCTNLRNAKYCIFNIQLNKEKYEEFLKENLFSSFEKLNEIKEKSLEVWIKNPKRNLFIINSVNVSGSNIENSKNSKNVFYATKVENTKYLNIGGWNNDCCDLSAVGASEFSYECVSGGGFYNSKFTLSCMASDPLKKKHALDLEYSMMVSSSQNCFGCVNLRNAEYSILNKRYSKEKYFEMVEKIKKQMNEIPYIDKQERVYKYGEFFPVELSPFGYNETVAMDYYPLEKEEALKKGFTWENFTLDTKYEFSDYIIPDDIKDVQDDILEKVLKCEVSGKAYKVIQRELDFYRRIGLPLPRKSPNVRHKERMTMLLPRKLWYRKCMKEGCQNEFETSYSPDRLEIIYCENCYNKEVY
ncbi:MAG: hypothetical protein WC822_03510 [Candidatus Paceibacterota bacterium]|jgi:hypothetical protein